MSDSESTSEKPEEDDEVKVELDLVKEEENGVGKAVPELLANRQESAALRCELRTLGDYVRDNSDRIRDLNDRLRDANDTTQQIQNGLMGSMREIKGMLERLKLNAEHADYGYQRAPGNVPQLLGNTNPRESQQPILSRGAEPPSRYSETTGYGYQGPMGNVRQIWDSTNRQHLARRPQIQYHSSGPAPEQSDFHPLATPRYNTYPGRHEASAMAIVPQHRDRVNRGPVRVGAVENLYLGDRQDTFEEFSPGHSQQVAEDQLFVESANEYLLTPPKPRSGEAENVHIPENDGKSTKTAQEPKASEGAAEEDDDHKNEDKQNAKLETKKKLAY